MLVELFHIALSILADFELEHFMQDNVFETVLGGILELGAGKLSS